jgi:predicted type IV restriction endonuclease
MPQDIRRPLRKILPHLLKAKKENINEADTCTLISQILHSVLDYDPIHDVSREVTIKEGRADFAVKLNGSVKFIVEAKAAGVTLRARHIGQAERYAAEGNIPWVLATNGLVWHLYHLTFDEGIEYETAFAVDLSVDELPKAAELIALLHKKSITKDEHEEFWEKRAALGPASIARSLFTEDMLRRVRREIRRHEGVLIDHEDLGRALHDMFSVEVREKVGPFKIIKRRKRKRQAVTISPPAPVSPAAVLNHLKCNFGRGC